MTLVEAVDKAGDELCEEFDLPRDKFTTAKSDKAFPIGGSMARQIVMPPDLERPFIDLFKQASIDDTDALRQALIEMMAKIKQFNDQMIAN